MPQLLRCSMVPLFFPLAHYRTMKEEGQGEVKGTEERREIREWKRLTRRMTGGGLGEEERSWRTERRSSRNQGQGGR